MQLSLRQTIFTIFVGLTLTSVLFGQTSLQKVSLKTNAFDLKINFPDVEGWNKSEISVYPVAALGYSVNYESKEGGRVTIYVYDGGKAKVASGVKDKVIKDEIEKAKTEIREFEKRGVYKDVKEVKNETIILGGESGKVESLHCLLSLSARGNDLTSEIYLFGYKNHFIKFRATRLYEKEDKKNQAMTDLLSALDKLFSDNGDMAFLAN